ncbi:MAG: thioredoxin family protein [Sphingomonas sp.]|nr:thioredoxin family protein [Sphingomonas sp.]
MNFNLLIPTVVVAMAAAATPAAAAQFRPFDTRAFAAAQAQGRPILVDVSADWCSTCRVQEKHIAKITSDPAFAKLIVFKLNYDTQKAERRRFKVPRQSTLIVFRGRREAGRSVADTNPGSIEALLRKALG